MGNCIRRPENEQSVLERYQITKKKHSSSSTSSSISSPPLSPSLPPLSSSASGRRSRQNSQNGILGMISKNVLHRRSPGGFEGNHDDDIMEERIVAPPQFLLAGQSFKKHHHQSVFSRMSPSKSKPRFVKISTDGELLIWYKRAATSIDSRESDEPDGFIKVPDITSVEKLSIKKNLSFSIQTVNRTLELEADSEEIMLLWVDGLNTYVKRFNAALDLEVIEIENVRKSIALELGLTSAELELVERESEAQDAIRKKDADRQIAYGKHQSNRDKLKEIRIRSSSRASRDGA